HGAQSGARGRRDAVDLLEDHRAAGVAAEQVLGPARGAAEPGDRGAARVEARRRVEPFGDVLAGGEREDGVRVVEGRVDALVLLEGVVQARHAGARVGYPDGAQEEVPSAGAGLRDERLDQAVLAAYLVPVGGGAVVDPGELRLGQGRRRVGGRLRGPGHRVTAHGHERDAARGERRVGGPTPARGPGEADAVGTRDLLAGAQRGDAGRGPVRARDGRAATALDLDGVADRPA